MVLSDIMDVFLCSLSWTCSGHLRVWATSSKNRETLRARGKGTAHLRLSIPCILTNLVESWEKRCGTKRVALFQVWNVHLWVTGNYFCIHIEFYGTGICIIPGTETQKFPVHNISFPPNNGPCRGKSQRIKRRVNYVENGRILHSLLTTRPPQAS